MDLELFKQLPKETQERLGEKTLQIILRRTLKALHDTLSEDDQQTFGSIDQNNGEVLSLFLKKHEAAFTKIFAEQTAQLGKELQA